MFKKLLFCVVALTILGSLMASSLEDKLSDFVEANGKLYLQPLVETIGAGLNSGLYTRASINLVNFRMGTTLVMVPKHAKKFSLVDGIGEYADLNGDTQYILPPGIRTATVLGDKGASHTIPGVGKIDLPPGLDLPAIVVPNAQIAVGLWKTELLLRYGNAPESVLTKGFGNISILGVGVKHSISDHIPLFPVNLAVQGAYQTLSFGDAVTINSIAFNAHASKSLIIFTIYGGIGWEKTDLNAEYKYTRGNTPEKIDFKLSANDVRTTVGFRIVPLPFINLYADYSQATYPTYNVGIGIGL